MTKLTPIVHSRIRQDVQSMHAYAIQDAAGMVKLDAMENPYTLSVELQTELGTRLGAVAVNRYPGSRIEDTGLRKPPEFGEAMIFPELSYKGISCSRRGSFHTPAKKD